MMTKKEALERLSAAYGCLDVSITETISLIQLDAFKNGMTRAANKIRAEIESCGCNGIDRNGCESCNAKENSRIDILTDRDNLKEV